MLQSRRRYSLERASERSQNLHPSKGPDGESPLETGLQHFAALQHFLSFMCTKSSSHVVKFWHIVIVAKFLSSYEFGKCSGVLQTLLEFQSKSLMFRRNLANFLGLERRRSWKRKWKRAYGKKSENHADPSGGGGAGRSGRSQGPGPRAAPRRRGRRLLPRPRAAAAPLHRRRSSA